MRYMLVLLVLLLAACATIFTSSSQNISVDSNPKGATIIVNTTGGIQVFEGTTPASVHLDRKNKYVVIVNLEGYREERIQIGQTLNPITIVNLLFWPGFIVDLVTGAVWNLDPDQLFVTLQTASLDGEKDQLYVLVSWADSNGEVFIVPVEMKKKE